MINKNCFSEDKKSEQNQLIFKKKICAICGCNSFSGKAYNIRISGNRTLKCHAFCIDKIGGFPESVSFLEKKLEGQFYFNSD